jgi:hypothetical protein
MRSQIGVPMSYSLSIGQSNSVVNVTLKSASGDYACSFTPAADETGFTTYGKGGYYTCEQFLRPFRCSNGTAHSLFSFGEDISGKLSGSELAGTWDAWWFDGVDDMFGVGVKAEYTGSR